MVILFAALALADDTTPPVPDLNVQLFRTSVDAQHSLYTDDAGTAEDGTSWGARAGGAYLFRPLSYELADGTRTAVISSVFTADAVGFLRVQRLRIGAFVPLTVVGRNGAGTSVGVGDLAFDVRATILDRRDGPAGLAVAAQVEVPTAPEGTRGAGTAGVGWELRAIGDAEITLGDLHGTVSGSLGYRRRGPIDLDGYTWGRQLTARVAAGVPVTDALGVSLEVAAAPNLAARSPGAHPVEAMVGGWLKDPSGWGVRAGLGTGLTRGIGAPRLRAQVLVEYAPQGPRDADGDGIIKGDMCPLDAEDVDGFDDLDGCPDPDNDGDGLVDAVDACPLEREDVDGNNDVDGCPDPPIVVALSITDPDGDAIPGLRVSLEGVSTVISFDSAGVGAVALEPGTYKLRAAADGFIALDVAVDVPEGDSFEVPLVLEPLVPLGVVRVMVVDEAGDPVRGAVLGLQGGQARAVGGGMGEVKMPPGKHLLLVTADGYVPSRLPILVDSGEEINLVVTLRAAAP